MTRRWWRIGGLLGIAFSILFAISIAISSGDEPRWINRLCGPRTP